MKAYIWDLDGTLIDSYHGIMHSLMDVLNHYGIKMKKEKVYNYILQKSVHELLSFIAMENNLKPSEVQGLYSVARKTTMMLVSLEDGAEDILKYISSFGMNFIVTHKGNAAYEILEKLGIRSYFTEIITQEDGFPMKPDPSSIFYLLRKYKVEKKDACYIGDRPLDILVAENAQITGILYKKEGSPVELDTKYTVSDLRKIKEIDF